MSATAPNAVAAALGRKRWAVGGLGVLTVLFLLIPLAVILPLSVSDTRFLVFPPHGLTGHWYAEVTTSSQWLLPLRTSVVTALIAASAATMLGTGAAFGLRRARRAGRGLRAAFVAPLVLPHVVLALGLYTLLARSPLRTTLVPLIAGQTLLALPLVVVVMSAALAGVDPALARAARSLGAGWATTAWQVELPLVRRALVGAFLFALVFCFDEVVLALFLAPAGHPTLPSHLWTSATGNLAPDIAAVATLIIGVALLAAALAAWLVRRRGRTARPR